MLAVEQISAFRVSGNLLLRLSFIHELTRDTQDRESRWLPPQGYLGVLIPPLVIPGDLSSLK